MVKVVKIWKGDLMMRSKSLAKNKDLQRKVLCSLLAAGVMSVCISGGDVWASNSLINVGNKEYSADTIIVADENLASDNSAVVGIANDVSNSKSGITMKNGTKLTVNSVASSGRAYAVAVNNGAGFGFVGKGEFTATGSDQAQARTIRNNGGGAISFDGDITVNTNAGKLFSVAVEAWDSSDQIAVVEFKGDRTIINAIGDKVQVNAIQVVSNNDTGSLIDFCADKTVITNTSTVAGGSNWANVAIVEGEKAVLRFSGKDVRLNSNNTGYTAQVISLNSNGNVVFNADNSILTAKSDFGANGIGGDGIITFNGKNATINAIVTDGVGTTNSIGLLSSKAIDVTTNVDKLAINVYGSGVWNGNPGYANGTAGIYANADVDIAAKNLAVNVVAGQAVDGVNTYDEETAKAQDNYSDAYGIRMMSGNLNASQDTDTNIVVYEGYKGAIGVSAEAENAIVNILGNTTITATGKTASNALLAEDGGQITVGSEGKTVDLTGEVKVDGGSVSNHGNVTINGQLLVKADGASSEYTSTGESLRINAGSDSAVQIENSSLQNVRNVLDFNAKNTELSSSGSNYISAVNILNNNQPDVTASNTVNFSGDTTKITATATDGKAQGVRIGESNFGSGKLTTDINFGATNTSINVKGNVVAGDYYDQVAGIWEGEGSYKGDVATNIAFNGKANIDVYSQGGNAYGIFVEHGSEIGTTIIDFNDNTVINAQNANGSGEAVYISGDGVAVNFNKAQKKGVTVDIIGDITAANNAKITLAGDSNVVKGTVTADAGGIVLAGSDKATYIVNKFVTKDSVSRFTTVTRGTITVSGGTLNIDNLSDINKFDLADNSLIVTGKGVLKAASDKVFEADTSGKKVIAGVDQKVLFNGGKLAISDASYTLADSKVYSEALGKVDDSGAGAKAKTTIVMTGTLQDQPVDNKATVDDLAPTGAVHTNVTGTVSTGTLNVGDGTSSEGATGVNNDLGVKDLDFSTNSGSGTVNANVTISNDTGLTLVGDGSSELLKGTGNSNNTVTVGSGSAGTLTLGNAAAESSGGTLNAAVTLQADSQMNVEAGSFTVGKITAAEGTVAVNAGANLTTTQDFTVGDASSNKSGTIDAAGSITAGKVDLQQGTVAVTGSLTANELSVGDSSNSKEGAVTAAGTVDVDTLNLNKGKVEVTGSLTAKTLTVVDSDAKIAVGAADSAGTLTAEDVKLGGASLMLDPAWEDSSTIQTASKAGLKFNSSQIDGKLTVGQNSVLSLGTADTAKAEAAFTDTGLTWGKNDITAALYIDYEQTMDSTKGGIKVDGSLTHASDNKDLAAANTATFAAGSLLMVAGDAALTTDGALKAGSTVNAQNNGNSNNDAATLKVDAGAKLYIADAQADKKIYHRQRLYEQQQRCYRRRLERYEPAVEQTGQGQRQL